MKALSMSEKKFKQEIINDVLMLNFMFPFMAIQIRYKQR